MGYALLEMSPAKVASTVLTLLTLGIVARWLYIGIILHMFVVASFFVHSIVPKPITAGGMGFEASELLVLFMFLVVVVKALKQRQLLFVKSPFSLPVVALGASVIMSIFVFYFRYMADPRGAFPFKHVYNTARPMFHYLFFFVVAFGLRNKRELKIVLNSLIVIGALVGILMVVQYIIGPEHRIFVARWWEAGVVRVEALSEEEENVTRSLPPAMFGMPFLLVMSLLLMCTSPRRQRLFYGFCGSCIGVGLIFTFSRCLWLPVLLMLVVAWLLSAGRVRYQLFTYSLVLVVLVALGSIGGAKLAPSAAAQQFGKAVTERFLSVFQKQEVLVTPSIQNRIDENRYAWNLIKENPILGIGVGSPVHYKVWNNRVTGAKVIYPVYQLHNSYLELWLVYGLGAVLAFAWITILVFVRSYVLYRRATDPLWRALALGIFCGWLQSLMTAFVAMTFLHTIGAICITALMWGSLEVAWRLYKQEIAVQDLPSVPVASSESVLRKVQGASRVA
jgi:hypothetical protein